MSDERHSSTVQAFVAGGLRARPEEITEALLNEAPVTWRTTSLLARQPRVSRDDLSQLIDSVRPQFENRGLRVVAQLRIQRLLGRSSDVIQQITKLPAYSLLTRGNEETGIASFAFDPGILPQRPPISPMLSWPLDIVAPENLAAEFADANAVSRGLGRVNVVSQPTSPRRQGPKISAQIVTMTEPPFAGPVLALRFLNATDPEPLPSNVAVSDLVGGEPAVYLPLSGQSAAERLTGFIYALSHDRPVDAAAWDAMRWGGGNAPPLVMTTRTFLDRARISDTVPALMRRLLRLPRGRNLQIDWNDLQRFGSGIERYIERNQPITGLDLFDALRHVREFKWDREADTGTGLLAVSKAVETAERELGVPATTARARLPLPSGQLGYIVPDFSPAPPAAAQSAAEPTSETKKTARCTDIKIFDAQKNPLDVLSPVVAGQKYTLDIAVRTVRQGLTADRPEQRPIEIPGQTDSADVWVVISDETPDPAADEVEGGFFKLNRRFGKLVLPVEGDSEGSATFEFSASPDEFRRRPGIQASLAVRLYHKLNLIDHIEIELRVEADAAAPRSIPDKPAINIIFKHPGGKQAVETPNTANASRILNISVTKARKGEDAAPDVYRFGVVLGDSSEEGKPRLVGSRKLTETMLNDFVARFRDLLLQTVFGPALFAIDLKVDHRDKLLRMLSKLGTDIVVELFDYQNGSDIFSIGQMLRQALTETSIIQISLSDDVQDFVFPWQILTVDDYDRDDQPIDPNNLWGYRYVLEIKRCGDGSDPRPIDKRDPTPVRMIYGRWNFGNEPAHFAALQDIADAAKPRCELILPAIETRDDFVDALKKGGGEVIYIYAHGQAAAPMSPAGLKFRDTAQIQIMRALDEIKKNPNDITTAEAEQRKRILETWYNGMSDAATSFMTLTFSEVTLTNLRVAMPPTGPRLVDGPIVFLNTCESAQIWNAVTGSFVGFFLTRGARAVLGTETTIPVVFAEAFGRAVLQALFAGKSLGQAVYDARQALLRHNRNPLGLCYSIYGAADARMFLPEEKVL